MPEIEALGATLVALSPQSIEKSAEMIASRKLGFDILRDEGNRVAGDFGLRFTLPADLLEVYSGFGIDLPASNGEASQTLPLPARYIIDTGGVVRYARVDPDYTIRPEPEETIAALRALS